MATSYRLIHDRIHHDLAFIQVEAVEAGPDTPLVVCLHGLQSDKESLLETCYRFAARGFRAVTMDLRLHGERDHSESLARRLEDAYVPTMLTIVEKSVADISTLLDHLGTSKAAIHGISMGGIVTFPALLAEPRLTVATIAMGTPDWVGMMELIGMTAQSADFALVNAYSPLTRAADMADCALLMLHGDAVMTVPILGVRRLAAKLTPLYQSHPERMDLVVYEGLGHTYIDDMLSRSIDWVERFL